jgi:membrane protein required for colicin V production
MTGFDILVLIVLGLAAAFGLLRGFVQEVLALLAWIIVLAAIHYFHATLAEHLMPYVGDRFGASGVLAFAALLIGPYVLVRFIANHMGEMSRDSLIGPIDRVIGLGFGALKGFVLIVIGFSILVLGYDTIWGVDGRPTWMTQAHTYRFVNAASESLVKTIAQRRSEAANAEHRRLDSKRAASK